MDAEQRFSFDAFGFVVPPPHPPLPPYPSPPTAASSQGPPWAMAGLWLGERTGDCVFQYPGAYTTHSHSALPRLCLLMLCARYLWCFTRRAAEREA
jgi:hypothetical protein